MAVDKKQKLRGTARVKIEGKNGRPIGRITHQWLRSTWCYECIRLINQKIEFYKLTNQKMLRSIR